MTPNNQLALAYDIILLLSALLFLTIGILGSKVIKLSAEQRLLDHVIWLRKHYLYSFVVNWQKSLSIPEKYCIANETEIAEAKEILSIFSSFIVSKYFLKELLPIRSKYVVSGEQFFARMLWLYLYQNSCKDKIGENAMHEKQLSQHRYGESFSDGFSATYSLTPFGIAYYKLYYTSFLFLGRSPIFNKKGTLFQESDAGFIKEVLDSASISISYRQEF